jgi:kynurenine formamidase
MGQLFEQIQNSRVYDLGQPYFPGIPHYPTHPPFLFGFTKRHGEFVLSGNVSSSADAIALGTHVGTHIDALCHFSCAGKLYGGVDANSMEQLAVDTIPPILRRGVLLDIAGVEGQRLLPADFAIRAEHLDRAVKRQGIGIDPGDVVLLRTGWGSLWDDPARYINNVFGPGPEREGAEWLSSRQVFVVGSDTVAFEKVPSEMQVHVHLLVEHGIHIIEALNLEQLAAECTYEFLFVAIPMKIRGATGAPVRPLALVGAG